MYDKDVLSNNDLIGSTMLSLADMISLAASDSGVELYKKGKFRGMLFVIECEVDQMEDMDDKGGKHGLVAPDPLLAAPHTKTYNPQAHHLSNPIHHHQPQSRMPPDYSGSDSPHDRVTQVLESQTKVRPIFIK